MGKPLKIGRPKTYQGLMTMGDDNLLSNTVASVLINGIMNAPLKGEKITFCIKVLCFKEIQKDIKLEYEKYGKVIAGMGNTYVLFYSIDDVKMLEEIQKI